MRVHLYTISWNEADIIPFFFRHYDTFVDRYVVYDDGSTDDTISLLAQNPKVEIRQFARTNSDSFVLSHQTLQNEVWKESRNNADWVVITAIDEHLTIRRCAVGEYLAECKASGVTLIPAIGYQMVSEEFPSTEEMLSTSRTMGAPSHYMNKLSIFNPSAVVDCGFTVGRHQAKPVGSLKYPARDELILLHYKKLNFERTLERQMGLAARLGKIDNENGWGGHYSWERQKLREVWDETQANAVNTFATDFDCNDSFEPPLWWRRTAEEPESERLNASSWRTWIRKFIV